MEEFSGYSVIATEIYDAIHDNVATKADVERLETVLKADVAAVRADMRELEQRLKLWLGSLIIATGGILFAALHYWPPHT